VGHVWMRAFIFVTDNPFAAVTDSQGRFALTDVTPGTYRLRVWHELLGTISRSVTVLSWCNIPDEDYSSSFSRSRRGGPFSSFSSSGG
jgi:hypothetical protein